MTREEEAIEVIKAYRDKLNNSVSNQLDGDIEAFNMAIKALSQEPKILDTIDFAIDASNGDTNYFVGFRNGLRYAKSLIDGEEPQYESCVEQEPCDDCRNCKKWDDCECGRKGHENGTSIGYSVGECKDFEPCTDAVSRQAILEKQYRIDDSATLSTRDVVNVDDIEELPSVNPQPCDGAISRILTRMWNCRGKHTTSIDKVKMEQIIRDELPSAPQKSGKWLYKEITNGYRVTGQCSECKERRIIDNFCPNCGARMAESEDKGMTKEQKDKILKLMAEERNHYARDCDRRIAKEEGKITGADYMLQRFLDVLRTEVEPQERSDDKE